MRVLTLLAILCATAHANPPSFAKAKKVATAWLRAMRKDQVPKSSSADIEVAIDSLECHGIYKQGALDDAADCIALTFKGWGDARWKNYVTVDDERLLTGSLSGKDGHAVVSLHVDASGRVTEVRIGYSA